MYIFEIHQTIATEVWKVNTVFIDIEHTATLSLKKDQGISARKDDVIRVECFPKDSPQFNAVEECWRQGKYDLAVSKYYPTFPDLKASVAGRDERL